MIDHLSYSSISAFLSCPAAWRFKYIDKAPTWSTPELVFGTAIHNTVENHIQNGGELLDLWPNHWQSASTDESRGAILWGADTPEQHYNEGIRILGHKDIQAGIAEIKAKFGTPGCYIERKVELRVPGVPVPVIGYIDIITADGVPGDFKTSSKSWSQDRASGSLQTLFYLAALNQAGVSVPDWKFRHYVIVKTKTPQFQVLEHQHNPKQLFFLFTVILEVWKAIESGVFVRNPDGWKCNPKYCDFWKLCRGRYI